MSKSIIFLSEGDRVKIKAVCEQTGLSDRAVRLYIDSGLIRPKNSENYAGRRSFDFDAGDVRTLTYVAALRKSGFSIAQIKTIEDHPESIRDTVDEVIRKLSFEKDCCDMTIKTLSLASDSDMESFASLSEKLLSPSFELPKEDERFRLSALLGRVRDGVYRSGVIDGIWIVLLLCLLPLSGLISKNVPIPFVPFGGGCALLSAGLSVLSATLLLRKDLFRERLIEYAVSAVTVTAAVGVMFLVWLILRIAMYPARPIENDMTVRVAELWVVFLLMAALSRVILLVRMYKRKKE